MQACDLNYDQQMAVVNRLTYKVVLKENASKWRQKSDENSHKMIVNE